MTRYTVVWHVESLDQLAQLWLESADLAQLAEATHRVDLHLSDDPELKGRPLAEGLRELVVPRFACCSL